MYAKWICKISALIAAGLFGLTGCSGPSEDGATGALNLGLTDGPVDNATAIHIQFTGLELKPAGGPAEIYPIDPDSCDVADTMDNCTIDIMKLQGTEYRSLFSEDLPAGDYQWVRLLVNAEQNVNDSYITIKNTDDISMECPLWIPSGGETGLKIVSGITVTANGVSNYMLDFDARTSVTAPPGLPTIIDECVQNYILKPAIRIVDETEVGSIAGTIDPSVLNTLNDQNEEVLIDGCRDEDIDGIVDHLDVYVFENFDAQNNPAIADDYDGQNDPITSAIAKWNDTNSTYEYEVGYLLAGEYNLGLTCTADVDVMPNTEGPIADNFNCDETNTDICEATDPPFDFVAERDVNVVIGVPDNNGDFPAP